MESFGPYQLNREIGSGYGSTVYSARQAGEGTDTFAVKVYALEPLVGDDPGNRADLNPLLQDLDHSIAGRINLQKKVGESSAYMAPVLESGQDERGIWYATRLYPRSLQKIIAGHVALTRENLFHVLRSMLRGTLDLKRLAGRSHGNLKPSNVLISGAARMLEAQVLLSDPMPGGAGEAANYERADLRAIGEILLQLVRRRELTESSTWLILPIESSVEWTEIFGKQSAAWLGLCNRLLDPKLSVDTYSLERLEQDLAALQPKPPVSPRLLAGVAGGVFVGVALAMMAFHYWNRGTVVLESQPPGATLYFKGDAKPIGQARKELKLRPGDYEFEARYPELASQGLKLTVAGRHTQTNYTFTFDYGTIIITSGPPGAVTRWAGKELTTPFTLTYVKPGEQLSFELNLGNHDPATVTAVVPKGTNAATFGATLAKKEINGVLVTFNCNLPRGEKITLNGSTLSNFEFEAPVQKKSMSVSRHTIVARYRDGWPQKTVTFVVQPTGENSARFDFDFGRIRLAKNTGNDQPAEVRYSVNGQPGGVVRLDDVTTPPLPPGRVIVAFEAEGFEPTNLAVNVVNSERPLPLDIPRLAQVLGFITLTSDPAPAMVGGAGTNLWRTLPNASLRKTLPPGPYDLTATFGGLKPVTQSVPVQRGRTEPVDFSFAYGKVRLTSNLPGAEVHDPLTDSWLPLDTPPTLILPEGPISLTARDRQHGLPDEALQFDVRGKQLARAFEFKWGTIIITTKPGAGVAVKTNDVLVADHTPWTNLFVKLGPVTYEVSWPEQKKLRKVNAFVVANSTTNILVDLTKEEMRIITNSIGMEFVLVKEGYYMGRWEVSQEQYRQVMGSNTPSFASPNQPATRVSFGDATSFCAKLTDRDKAFLTANLLGGFRYTLPGENEWKEFAFPSPQTYASAVFNFRPIQNVGDPSRTSTNDIGLYDMFGNVAEWCLGANQERITLGGHNQRSTPQKAGEYYRAAENQLGPNVIANGNLVTGFRCLLRSNSAP